MVASAAERFTPPPIPWRHPLALEPAQELGPGLDPQKCGDALARLCAEPDVQAVIAFGSRARGEARPDSDLDLAVIVGQPQLTPTEKLARWKRFNRALGRQGVAVDLVVAGSFDAERLSGSRWHVFGDVAREGRVLYVAR
ncbi:MAG: nucleotidyltransferase domain-containing protein [Synechococcus sp.]|jgi:predicted nucleotidyltransferase|nr:nucleotidyltransferase domain-containing protein [Synechococcus sp.]